MVRKIGKQKKKEEPGILDITKLSDLTPVFSHWFNLIGEGEDTKELFNGCKKKEDFLKVFHELSLDKHPLMERLDTLRKSVVPFISNHNGTMTTHDDKDVVDHGSRIEERLRTMTPLGYFETLKTLGWIITTAYVEQGKESELPDFTVRESNFKPEPIIINFRKEK